MTIKELEFWTFASVNLEILSECLETFDSNLPHLIFNSEERAKEEAEKFLNDYCKEVCECTNFLSEYGWIKTDKNSYHILDEISGMEVFVWKMEFIG